MAHTNVLLFQQILASATLQCSWKIRMERWHTSTEAFIAWKYSPQYVVPNVQQADQDSNILMKESRHNLLFKQKIRMEKIFQQEEMYLMFKLLVPMALHLKPELRTTVMAHILCITSPPVMEYMS